MKDLNFNEDALAKIERIIARLENLKLKFNKRNDDDYFDDILLALISNIFPTISYIEAIINPDEPGICKEELRKRLFEKWEFLYLGVSKKHFIFLTNEEKQIVLKYENDEKMDSFIKDLYSELKSVENTSYLKSEPYEIERISSKIKSKNHLTGLEHFFEF